MGVCTIYKSHGCYLYLQIILGGIIPLTLHNLMLGLTPEPHLRRLHRQSLAKASHSIELSEHRPTDIDRGVVEGDVGGDGGVVREQEGVDGGGVVGEVDRGLVVA
jgi:hypothetical protein